MKTHGLIIALLLLTLGLSAQSFEATIGGSVVAPEEVPAAVKASQEQYFPGVAVRSWRMLSASVTQGSGTVYVSVFTENQTNTHAQYTAAGQGIAAITQYAPNALPTGIQQALSTTYADYKLTGAALVKALPTGTSAYRLRLRKAAQKLTVWVDENGKEVSGNQIPDTADPAE